MWKKHYASAKSSLDRIDGERKFVVHYEDLKRSPQSVIGNLAEHFSFPIDKNNIEDMVENSKSYRLKLYGEFSKRGTEKELLPEGFARLDTDKQQLPRVLNSLEKAFQKIYLHSEMKELGYLE